MRGCYHNIFSCFFFFDLFSKWIIEFGIWRERYWELECLNGGIVQSWKFPRAADFVGDWRRSEVCARFLNPFSNWSPPGFVENSFGKFCSERFVFEIFVILTWNLRRGKRCENLKLFLLCTSTLMHSLLREIGWYGNGIPMRFLSHLSESPSYVPSLCCFYASFRICSKNWTHPHNA